MSLDSRFLKILHIDPEKAWGGGESEVICLLSYLSLWGHQCHLVCHPQGILLKEAQKIGITTFPVHIRNDLDMRQVPFLRWLIRRGQYDIVHFHTKRAHALSLCLGHILPNIKFVVTRRMDYPVKRNWYTHYLYNRRVDGIIAISHKISEVLVEGGVKRDKIRVIHTGIDPEPFLKAQRPHSNFGKAVIGTAAVLEERKGHRFLLEAAALLKQKGHHLIYRFAGEGSQRARLQEIALRLGLKDVFFEGFVSDMPNFLSQIDIFVLPSLYEGMGVAILEAMAARKVVVASRVGGIPELVEDGVTGLLVPPGDPGALASSISRLGSQRGLINKMGMKASERVRRYFTMEQTAKKVEDYYYELCQPLRQGAMRVNDPEGSDNLRTTEKALASL